MFFIPVIPESNLPKFIPQSPNLNMRNHTLNLFATSTVAVLAVPTVQMTLQSSPLQITHISADGPTCNSGNTSPPITQTNANLGATGQVGFDAEIANAKPEGDNRPYSDCTLTVDFNFPIGFHINGVHALAQGDVNFGDGMTQVVRMDIWFPSNNGITVSISHYATYFAE
jgi:hypothetical protein